MLARALRPLEWALLAFFLFVLLWAGPGVFPAWKSILGGRATTVMFALGLVASVQLFWRFTALPWNPKVTESVRRVVWTALPLSLLPWLFALSVVVRGEVFQELLEAEARTQLAAGAGMFMFTVGFGLPTFLGWLLFANLLREHGEVRWPRVRSAFVVAASTFRDWLPLLIVLSGYEWMRGVVEAGFTGPRDELMRDIDLKIFFGTDPLDLLEKLIWKPFTEVIAFAYSFYAVLFPLVLGTVSVTGGKRALRISAFRVGIALLIAYVGYALVPVKGPLFTRTFNVPLDTYLVGPIKEAMMDATRISYDCFPSMHTCCTLLLGVCAFQFARKLFWIISPIVVLMPLACVYLRYHYVIDVIVGAALVFPIVWLSKKLEKWITPDDDSAAARVSR